MTVVWMFQVYGITIKTVKVNDSEYTHKKLFD